MPIMVSIAGADELRALSDRLKKTGREDLYRVLRRRFKDAGKPTVAEIRAAVMRVKVTRGLDDFSQQWDPRAGRMVLRQDLRTRRRPSTTLLRTRVARATSVSVTRRGIRIVVSAKKVGDYGVTLPRYLDGSLRRWHRWRHPVYGDTDRWVTQHGQSYFFVTIKKYRAAFRKAAFRAMTDIAEQITG